MRWLIDEMFPAAVADRLQELGHDARAAAVSHRATPDDELLDVAVSEGRVVVTENIVDFVALLERRLPRGEPAAPVVFVLKAGLPADPWQLSIELARRLDAWAAAHREPAVTAYWL